MTLFYEFFNQAILQEIMQSLALGLITVTVAVAILLIEKGTVFAFDQIVIFKKVIQGKSFLVFFMLLFAPLFLWDLGDGVVKFLLFISYLAGLGGFFLFLFRSYKWIGEIETEDQRIHENYRQKKRLEYLEEISTDPQRLLVWEYIWQLKNKSAKEERTYIEKFKENINFFLERDNEKDAVAYLSSFKRFVNNITLRDRVIFGDIFKALLEWHYKIFSSYSSSEENKHRDTHLLLVILERLIGTFIEKGLQLGASYVVFETLKNFVTEKSNENKYIERLVSTTARVFFDHISDSPELHTIWSDYFPKEWKVTKETIKNKENLMAKLWLDHFLQWAQERIWKHVGKDVQWDKQLDAVSEGLFPFVDPKTWAIILTFLIRPWRDGQRMKDLIEIPRRFGFFSLMFEEPDRRIEEQRNNAIDLALIIFRNRKEFTKEKLQEYIREVEQLSYKEEPYKAKYRDQIKRIFEDMLDRHEKQSNETK